MNLLKGEEFKTVEGFDNYQISNFGRVYSQNQDRLLKPQKDAIGYYHVRLYDPLREDYYKNGLKKPTLFKVHRLVALHFLDEPKDEKQININHIDEDKSNNHYENLEWCTQRQNMLHSWKTGLMKEAHRKGSLAKRIPLKIEWQDGTEKYYPSMNHASCDTQINTQVLRNKMNQEVPSFGRKGIKVYRLDKQLSWDEFFHKIEDIELKLLGMGRYFNDSEWRKGKRMKDITGGKHLKTVLEEK